MQEQLADAHAALQAAATAEARAERAGRDRETAEARADELRTRLDEMQASRREVVEVAEAVTGRLGARQMGAAQAAGVAGRIRAPAQLAEVQRRHEMRYVGADATVVRAIWRGQLKRRLGRPLFLPSQPAPRGPSDATAGQARGASGSRIGVGNILCPASGNRSPGP
jgi:hypothetical protein